AKMSKSLGNIEKVHDLVRAHPPEALRYALISAHYRQPLEWSDALVEQSVRTLDRLYGTLRDLADIEASPVIPAEIAAALDDDLNTPLALAELSLTAQAARSSLDNLKNAKTQLQRFADDPYSFDPSGYKPLQWTKSVTSKSIPKFYRDALVETWKEVLLQREILELGMRDPMHKQLALSLRREIKLWRKTAAKAKSYLLGGGLILGLLQQAPEAWFNRGASGEDDARIQALVDERSAAKKARDFARADAIRDQ